MVDRMMAPKDIHILIPRTCEYVSLHGKKNFAGVTKLRILIWGDYAVLSGWTQSVITRVFITGKQKLQSQK